MKMQDTYLHKDRYYLITFGNGSKKVYQALHSGLFYNHSFIRLNDNERVEFTKGCECLPIEEITPEKYPEYFI